MSDSIIAWDASAEQMRVTLACNQDQWTWCAYTRHHPDGLQSAGSFSSLDDALFDVLREFSLTYGVSR